MAVKNQAAKAASGFDDDFDTAGAPAAPRGTKSRDAGAAGPIGEMSRFADDFESATETDQFADKWIEGGTLPEIDPRPGFVQRYVNTLDGTNLHNQLRRGWRPRRSDTLPANTLGAPTIQHGEYNGCVGVNGQVLMEMPIALHQRHQQAQRNATAKQQEAIEANIYKVKGPGMAAVATEATTRASVGRVPNIPEE